MGGKAAILLSRQALRPCGRSQWVVNAASAVQWLHAGGYTLLGSCGMQTWELVTACASLENVRQVLYLPAADEAGFESIKRSMVTQFDLGAGAAEFVPVVLPGAARHALHQLRDETIIHNADVLLPLSIRPNGNMARLLRLARSEGKRVLDQFQTPYEERETPLSYSLAAADLDREIRAVDSEYVIHWTRSANAAWPTEKLIDYYQAIIGSDSYPRTGLDTLTRIITQKKIAASSWRMPGGAATVSFSDLSPVEVVPLMRWRARRSQMSFEPYGIGIRRDYALDQGIQPVQYYAKGDGMAVPGPVWLTQSAGIVTDWRAEHEYRCLGDFDLSIVPANRLAAFTYLRNEAQALQEKTGLKVISFLP